MLSQFYEQLGAMAIPLVGLSVIALALILERLVTYTLQPGMGKARVKKLFVELQNQGCGNCRSSEQAARYCGQKHCLHQGVGVLMNHASSSKDMREEVAGLWLLKHRQRMHAGLRFLMLIGMLSPMIGLLGTVLGMIMMFQGMAASGGPVTPAVLADGLWAAMYTTAYGLGIAIPSLAASHGFTLWANRYMSRLEFVLNHVNLMIEGVDATEPEVRKPAPSNVAIMRKKAVA
ncbi:MotA/TolQ/ExbB proton channel family protein [Sansalvadorimonas verongulae]|uniref:MotA/TolQ/ExbB proton channel family protein n=1 Tax=Sansalvadorimonas verongulae TaxID=2172824 RepID=UPI0012BD71C2|nr:MotA/TolQ/ExbB proton channel family protein [Sansalvadorimonas verongulae]MTI13624.1 MotA/TolQ/ExbB proton channel family protein [Sansalvadorimonas verongulae]